MRYPVMFVSKLAKKAAALLVLSVLSIFSWICNVLFLAYRLLAVSFATIGILISVVEMVESGISTEGVLYVIFFVGMVVLRYLIPYFLDALRLWKDELKAFIDEPIIIKSPVRYTI